MPLLLEGQTDDRDLIISGLRTRVRDLEQELQEERSKAAAITNGAKQLRMVLNPLYNALRTVYGEMDAIGVKEDQTTFASPKASAAWESWKQKLGGQAAKAIDALLLHGALTQTQLRIHISCAKGSVPGIVYQLNKASLINKNGGKISLKEL